MTTYYIVFENEDQEEILQHPCKDYAEQQKLINAWLSHQWMDEFPNDAEYAYPWSPVIEHTPADTTRRSVITGQYKPGGIDY